MDELLAVMPVGPKAFKGKSPLVMEFQVNKDLSPYLVTAAGKSKFIWLPKSRNGRVRAAFRSEGRESLFLDIIQEVSLCGRKNKWGNIHEFSESGLADAINHLRYYDINDIEVLASPAGLPFGLQSGVTVTPTPWVPEDMAVVVPKNRDFLGFVADIPNGSYLSVVHNPSRGLAVAVRHANG